MKKLLFIILLLFCVNVSALNKKSVTFDKCVDGDTVWLKDGSLVLKYRFLAIDTPEIVHPNKNGGILGKTASEYTCNMLKSAKKIEVEYDKNSDKKDKYGRELVWIYLDNKLFQKDLIEKGYAKIKYIYGNYEYVPILKEVEEKAKSSKVGIWGNVYRVIFKFKEYEKTIEVIEGSKVDPINIEDIKGYNYIGWFYEEKPFDFNTLITKDITLNGKYKTNLIIYRILLIIAFLIVLYIIDKEEYKKELKKIVKKSKKHIFNNKKN